MKKQYNIIKIVLLLIIITGIAFYFRGEQAQAADQFKFTIKKNKAENAVKISFEKSSGVKKYVIQMKSEADKKYKTIKTLVSDGSDSYSYTEKNLAAGKYSFRVKRYDGQQYTYGKGKSVLLEPEEYDGFIMISYDVFPDDCFMNYVELNYDIDNDGRLSEKEIKDATVMVIDKAHKKIFNLKGIEIFTSLKTLDCSGLYLKKLDVSKNTTLEELYCNYNMLKKLKIGKNKVLRVLNCAHNELEELDLSKLPALEELYCANNRLNHLNLAGNTSLIKLECRENGLFELDLSKCILLKELECRDNALSRNLDLSNNMALEKLYISFSGAKNIDLRNNTCINTVFYSDDQTIIYDYRVNKSDVFMHFEYISARKK